MELLVPTMDDWDEKRERLKAKYIVEEMRNQITNEAGKGVIRLIFWGAILVAVILAVKTGFFGTIK